MDYSKLNEDELEELFFRTRDYHFRVYLNSFLHSQKDERLSHYIENIRNGLKILTPNVIEWAFNNQDWRPAQSMATYVACGKLGQYTDLVGRQLHIRRYCYPYIYPLARIATGQAVSQITYFLEQKMTVDNARSYQTWNYEIDIAYALLHWLDKSLNMTESDGLNSQWHKYKKALIDAQNYEPEMNKILVNYEIYIEKVKQEVTNNMNFFSQHFD
ncbi:MAG: DUF6000 family protein [Chloroflexota bacterium]